ncbi:MAG: trigger factor [Microgenomates group bacterium]|jgi:trigger factor
MYTHTLKKLPKGTFEITVKMPWAMIEKETEKAFQTLAEMLEVEGYRKGKAPKELAKKQIKKEAIYQQIIRTLFPDIYAEIIKKEELKPVISPRVDLKQAKENEDWELVFTLAEKPSVKLGDYKKTLADIKVKRGKADIWVPGTEAKPVDDDKEKARKQQELLNEMLTALLQLSTVEISEFILEEELNSRLSRLVDDIQKLGMNTETYLQSKNITMEQLREQFLKEIVETHSLEFALNEIAEKENISVENDELEKLFVSIKDNKERVAAMQNAYYYAALLRKQKTLDFLLGL